MSDTVACPLAMHLFGPFEVRLYGHPLPRLRTRKGQWLLALLALRAGSEVERAWLAGTLWPESSESQAQTGLRTALSDLRRALGDEARRLRTGASRTVALDLAGAVVDVLRFDAALARGDAPSLEQAIALYRGPLLEGCPEEWVFEPRQSREEAYLGALERLAEAKVAAADLAGAQRCLRRLIAAHPLRETAYRTLMQTLAAGRSTAEALEAYRELRTHLRREVDAEPDAATTALYHQLRGEARCAGGRAQGAGSGEAAGRRAGDAGPRSWNDEEREGSAAVAGRVSMPSVPMVSLPPHSPEASTLTFLFAEGEEAGDGRVEAPGADPPPFSLLRDAVAAHGGHLFEIRGSHCRAAFTTAPAALAAALATLRAGQAHGLASGATESCRRGAAPLRFALHTGAVEAWEGAYFGLPLDRAARLLETGHPGQILLSLAAQELVRDHLPDGARLGDLGQHRLRDLVRPEHLFQLIVPDLPADFPPLQSLDSRPHNLPGQPTPLIGREKEVAAALTLLRHESARLITFSGPAGTGKTRLGLQVAAAVLDRFPDGVWFVPLAAIRDPALVPAAIAQALDAREVDNAGAVPRRERRGPQPDVLLATLKERLRAQRLLLVLDNFEQVLPAATLVAELLAAIPYLKILITSRAVLHLRGEKEFPVPPLALPPVVESGKFGYPLRGWSESAGKVNDRSDPKHAGLPTPGAQLSTPNAQLSTLTHYAAVELFIQRAVDVKPGFAVSNENAPAIAAICRRLDGLPLAIELAAARIRLFSPQALLERLAGARFAPAEHLPGAGGGSASLQLLTGGARDLPARQQTLRGAIAWSYDLLDEPEKALFRRLSVFSGGCSLAAAESVVRGPWPVVGADKANGVRSSPAPELPTDPRPPTTAFVDLIASLVDKSLLRQNEASGGEVRVWMLETIREYGRECLEASGEAAAVRDRHADYFLAWAMPEMWDLDRLESEHDNLRAALAWYREREAPEPAFRLGMALWWLWYMGGHWAEGREQLTALLAMEEVADDGRPPEGRMAGAGVSHARAALLRRAGQLAGLQGDYPAARALLEESVALYRRQRCAADLPAPLNALGEVARIQGDYDAARRRFEESLALLRAAGEKPFIAWALQGLGEVAHDQNDPGAPALMEQCRALFEEVGDQRGVAIALSYLGEEARAAGDLGAAHSLHEQSLALLQQLGHKAGIARAQCAMARVKMDQGEWDRARAHYTQSLLLHRELGDRRGLAACLEGFAGLAARSSAAQPAAGGPVERAAQLFGAAEAVRAAIGAPLPPVDRPEYERQVAGVRVVLGDPRLAAAWSAGRALSLDQAIALALGTDEVMR